MGTETLAEYLERVMRQKNLKIADVEALSGLSPSYIGRLLKGKKTNLTVESIGGLAKALEGDAFELFAAAYGKSPESASIDLLHLVDTIQKLILNAHLIELVQNAAKLKSEEHQKVVSETVKVLASDKKADKKRKE